MSSIIPFMSSKSFFFFFGPNIASTLFSHRMNPTHKIRIYYLLFNNIFPRWNIAFLSSQFYFLIIPRSQQLPLISHHLFWWWLAYGWNGKGLEWKWMFKRGGRQLWKLDTFGYAWHFICLVEILQLDKPNIRVLFVPFHQSLIMVFRHASSCTTL